jgi:hypothetical protein
MAIYRVVVDGLDGFGALRTFEAREHCASIDVDDALEMAERTEV